jgi:probable phosphoglycerate mutase
MSATTDPALVDSRSPKATKADIGQVEKQYSRSCVEDDPEGDEVSLRLYFIRHGETEWSLSGRHTGRTDVPLTAHGEDGARALAPWLGAIHFTRVLTSPLQRAGQTCALAGLGGAAEIEPDLSEWDYGDYEGQRSLDIQETRANWNLFRDGCPHGETSAQISDRADRLIAKLRNTQGNVALFSHGQFGSVLAARWIELPVIDGQHFALNPASLSILAHNAHHTEVRVIELWNAGVRRR